MAILASSCRTPYNSCDRANSHGEKFAISWASYRLLLVSVAVDRKALPVTGLPNSRCACLTGQLTAGCGQGLPASAGRGFRVSGRRQRKMQRACRRIDSVEGSGTTFRPFSPVTPSPRDGREACLVDRARRSIVRCGVSTGVCGGDDIPEEIGNGNGLRLWLPADSSPRRLIQWQEIISAVADPRRRASSQHSSAAA
jgi:hypothetical protein